MTNRDVSLMVNDESCELEVESHELLIHTLRDEIGYTGPNLGCETGVCGACTVHVNGNAVKACMQLTVQVDGADITTIEGLSETGDHPLQEGFHEEHGLQCGYCTPGMIMTAADYLTENPDPDRDEVRSAIKGNICRCTGYHNIVDAVQTAANAMNDSHADSTNGGE